MRDITLADTFYQLFTTRAFATGVPTVLAGSPVVSAYENEGLTQITAGITLGVDHDGVVGLNLLTVVASGANGYEAGKDYGLVITVGTVGGVSVVGEVVAEFSIGRSAAAVDLANGTDGLGAIKADTAAILLDTAEIGTAGAGLTNIDLPNQTMDITGNLSGSVGSVTGAVGSVTGLTAATVHADLDDIQTRLPAALTANGNMKSSLVEILTTALTETAGLLAGGFKKFFNIATPTGTVNSLPDAAPDAAGGLPISDVGGLDLDAQRADVAAILTDTGTTLQAEIDGVQADTEDIQARLPAALTADGNIKTDTLYCDGAVWFDAGGAAGTTNYVNGTLTNPSSSMANSRTIANALGLKKFMVLPGSTVTLDQGYNGFAFMGEKWTLDLATRLITNSFFEGATVSGVSTGTGAQFDECVIGAVTIADASTFRRCGLSSTFTVGAAGTFIFDGCYSASAAGVDAIIDFGALGASFVALRNYAGGVEVRNMAAGDVLAFVGSGRLTIAASCTAGTVFVSGPINLVNGGSGQTITDTSRLNEDQSLALVTLVTTTTDVTNDVGITQGAADKVWLSAARVLTAATNITSTGGTTVPQTGDSFALVNGASGVVAIKGVVDDILADTGTTLPATLATIAGYLDTEIAAILADTNELQTDWVNGGRLDLLIDLIKAATDQFVFTTPGQVDATAVDVSDKTGYAIGTGGIAAAAFAANAVDAAALATDAVTEIVAAIFARAFSAGYSSLTFDQIVKVAIAALAGKASGLATTNAIYRNLADSANVIDATVTADGDRTAVVLTP